MEISDAEHEELQDALQKLNAGAWLQLATEIRCHGRDASFWFLISGPDQLRAAASIVLPILHEAAIRFDGTKFSASFSEKRDNQEIIWDFVTEDELCAGIPDRELGASPAFFKLRPWDVFGPNPSAQA